MNGKAHRQDLSELLRQQDLRTLGLDPPRDVSRQQAALDRLAALARQVFGTGASAVTIVGRDRVWFVGTAGIPGGGDRRREHTVCDRVIRQDGLTVIADTRQDPELGISPAVVEGEVVFYAGAPIHSREGSRIGTVCVWDRHARPEAMPNDFTTLLDLAGLAAETLELRRAEQPAAGRNPSPQIQACNAVMQSLGLCCVVFDQTMRIVLASPAFSALIGRPAEGLIGLSLRSMLETPPSAERLQQLAQEQLPEPAMWQLRTYGYRVQTMECEISPVSAAYPLFVARLRHPQRKQLTRQSGPHVVRILGQLRRARTPVEILRDVLKMAVQELGGRTAIVSLRSSPGQRILIGEAGCEEFCDGLEQHHRFEPAFSICATTCESGQSTISADTRLEDRWPNYGWLDLAYGIRAVWSTPIHSAGHRPDAALTVFREAAGEPSVAQMAVLREAAALASLAVERLDLAALARTVNTRAWSMARFMAMYPHLQERIAGDGALVAHAVALSEEHLRSGLDLPWAERMIREVTGDAAIMVASNEHQVMVVTRASGEQDIRMQRDRLRRQLRIDAVGGGRSRRLQCRVASLPVADCSEATALLARLSKALNPSLDLR